jgi:acyl carrier protein
MNKASLHQELKELIIRELNLEGRSPDELDDSAPLFGEGLGLDSLDALQLAMAVEERYRLKLPDGDEVRRVFSSIASLAEYIERSAPAG